MDEKSEISAETFPRLLLVDDQRLLLDAFKKLLAEKCEIVGTAENGSAALEVARRLKPDVVVMDVSMPVLNGFEAGRLLRAELPDIKLIFLTVHDDPGLRAAALQMGASGYLLKNAAASELLDAIAMAVAGDSYFSPTTATGGCGEADLFATQLTDRQRDVLRLIAKGHIMKEVATKLGITPRTVAFHKYEMMHRLGVTTTAELIALATRAGWVGD